MIMPSAPGAADGQDEAVLNGAGFAFIGVADDVFFVAGRVADQFPLQAGGKARAAEAGQPGFFQWLMTPSSLWFRPVCFRTP
jgi:hypothetical protein